MTKTETYYKFRIALLILFCTILFSDLFADSPCGTFVLKVTYYTNSGRQDSGYTFFKRYSDKTMVFNFIDEYYTIIQRVQPNQIDFSKIKGCDSNSYNRILAVSKSVMCDTNVSPDFNGYIDLKALPITDSIYVWNCFDTINYTHHHIVADFELGYSLDSAIYPYHDIIHYANTKYLNLDTIKLILLDSILWCGDNDQLEFLTANQVRKTQLKNLITHFRLADSDAQQFWIDFFCFDPQWTKSKILSLLDIAKIDNTLIENGGDNVFYDFPPILQQAIQLDKVLYFVRWSP